MKALRIMTPGFELKGEITGYTSLQLTRRHFGTGAFTLVVPARNAQVMGIEFDDVLFSPAEPHKAMLVEGMKINEGQGEVVITGCTLDGLTRRRVCVPPVSGQNPDGSNSFGWDRIIADAETVFHHFMNNNLINPKDDPARAMQELTLAVNLHRGMANVPWQARFDSLAELLERLGEFTDMGWDIRPDFDVRRFVFDVRPGRDLAVGNLGVSHVLFSLKNGVAVTIEHQIGTVKQRNIAYAGGHGDDEERLILQAGEVVAGIMRREMWIDGGSIDLAPELTTHALRKLAENGPENVIKCEVRAAGAFKYGRDWDLGDRITVLSPTGRLDARITETQEVYERGKPEQIKFVTGGRNGGVPTLDGAFRKIANTIAR